MKALLFILILTLSVFRSEAQLTNGSIAPNFSLTDINGVKHDLYSYLDAGKTVYIDFFAAHCPYCWSYKNTGAMKNLFELYGPNGTENQNVVVIAIEHDPNNGINELNGTSGYTQGNWLAGVPYPIINPEGADRTAIIANYAANYYPLIYGICPDRKIKVLGTVSTNGLYNYHVGSCQLLDLNEKQQDELTIAYNVSDKTLQVNSPSIGELILSDQSGKTVYHSLAYEPGTVLNIDRLPGGVYLVSFSDGEIVRRNRIVVH